MTRLADLPHVELGTILRLAAGEWSGGLVPSAMDVVIRVSKIHIDQAPENPSGVWVSGHMVECAWASVEDHAPCTTVYAFLEPLAREVIGRGGGN